MAKYPVDISDKEGIVDAVNYALSGPSGLGQNFAGFSDYKTAYLTGNFRVPYSQTTPARLYVAPIALSSSEMLDGRTYKFTFATTQKTPPFALGNGITIDGVDNNWYNDTYGTIGITKCTTTYCIVRTVGSYSVRGPASGGTISLTTGTGYNSTDCNARVTVTGGSDKVFISAQLANLIAYAINTTPAALSYSVAVNRYKGEPNNDPVNPDYVFGFDETVSERVYAFSNLTGSANLNQVETVFTSILDQPPPGYYWYILEVKFEFNTHLSGTTKISNGQVLGSVLSLRSLSAQVVKQ